MPPELRLVLLLSVLNPAAIAVGYLLGRRADQPQKIVVAAFPAGIAGVMFGLLVIVTGLTGAGTRLLAGIFIVSGLVGMLAAWIGFRRSRSR